MPSLPWLFLEEDSDTFMNIFSILKFYQDLCGLKINLIKIGLADLNMDIQIFSFYVSLTVCEILQWPLIWEFCLVLVIGLSLFEILLLKRFLKAFG